MLVASSAPRRLKLRRGDLLIAGTDGLFDNIGDSRARRPVLGWSGVLSSTGRGVLSE